MSNTTSTYSNSLSEVISNEDIVEYTKLFSLICDKSDIMGFRHPVCGNFLEAVARKALNLRKPATGDAIDANNHLIEIKSTRFGGGLGNTDLSIFGYKEVQEDSFDDLVLVVWDPALFKIFIYDTGWSSKKLRSLKVNKTQLVQDKATNKRNSVVKIMEKIIRPSNILPCSVFNINKGVFENYSSTEA